LSESNTSNWGIRGFGPLFGCSLMLILLCLTSLGCTKRKPIPFQPDHAICRNGNNEQLASWDRMVELAAIDFDPYEIRLGTLWAGGHLWRCRNLTPQ
jgi:hypothetical protein